VSALRKHPLLAVGDRFGHVTVVRLVEPDYTRNERAEVACDCGHLSVRYAHNVRKRPHCNHTAEARDRARSGMVRMFGSGP